MAELTKTVDGNPLPASKFAYVGDAQNIATWHLPIDKDHIESALKMFGHEKHVPEGAMTATAKKIAAAAKDAGLDTKNFTDTYLKTSEHGEAQSPWIEIFRAGDYRAQGKSVITRSDLERVIRNYDPTYHEAPVCVGHPKDNLPAYGWIDRLALDGDVLLAREKQVDPKFNEARQAGRYKKRSAAFYQDAAGNVAGLRHVAYLGAQPPEVKGLQDVQFNDSGRTFIVFGEEESVADEKTMEERLKAFFSELFGRKTEGATFSEADVKRIAGEAVTAATQPLTTKITQLETDLKSQGTAFSEREQKIAGAEVAQRGVDAITRLKSAGKWIPAYEKMGLGLVFGELAKTSATVEFGEGDAKKQVAPLQLLVEFLEGLPKIVPGGTNFTGVTVVAGGKGAGDPLTDAARARQKEKNITFSEALDQVAQENPELTRPGAAAAGAV
ncbi:hypothetical protein H7849_11890 [Alloacidobacterium dinghuense]|uniref:Mu-like prophage I protein n=1 Tax=Alloacidobacterium dinghuense TaxID=2763107 RepID=A0A7G8BPQ7_9BACT|nr:hypothetical protein [Alloacidobacterium dinghuense]QNI34527.1 hypothetical protein H7849_11890 [Alloacidobacterium dinghuense]